MTEDRRNPSLILQEGELLIDRINFHSSFCQKGRGEEIGCFLCIVSYFLFFPLDSKSVKSLYIRTFQNKFFANNETVFDSLKVLRKKNINEEI